MPIRQTHTHVVIPKRREQLVELQHQFNLLQLADDPQTQLLITRVVKEEHLTEPFRKNVHHPHRDQLVIHEVLHVVTPQVLIYTHVPVCRCSHS